MRRMRRRRDGVRGVGRIWFPISAKKRAAENAGRAERSGSGQSCAGPEGSGEAGLTPKPVVGRSPTPRGRGGASALPRYRGFWQKKRCPLVLLSPTVRHRLPAVAPLAPALQPSQRKPAKFPRRCRPPIQVH